MKKLLLLPAVVALGLANGILAMTRSMEVEASSDDWELTEEAYNLVQKYSERTPYQRSLPLPLRVCILQLVECIRAYDSNPDLGVLDLAGLLPCEEGEIEGLLSSVRYFELGLPQVVGACLLLKYSQTIRDCREDLEGPLYMPEEYEVCLHTWLEILCQYDLNPTVDVRHVAELITRKDKVSLIRLANAAFFLNLPRVFCSAVLHRIVVLFDSGALDWDTINSDIKRLLAGHYAIKGGQAPKDTGIGFSIAELLAYEKLPGINYDGRLPLGNLNLDSLEGFSLINDLEHLRFCDLSRNMLEMLTEPFLVHCEYLESLNLSDNRLKYLPKDFLANNRLLRELDISGNPLPGLPAHLVRRGLRKPKVQKTMHGGFIIGAREVAIIGTVFGWLLVLGYGAYTRKGDIIMM